MSSQTNDSHSDSHFECSDKPGMFDGLLAALRYWVSHVPPDKVREIAAPPVIEAIVPAAAVPPVHYLRRVAGSAGRWKRQIAEAQLAWPRASRDELVATDGHVQRLIELLQHHYALSPEEARAQVLQFFAAQTV